jgi:hypothetical protein
MFWGRRLRPCLFGLSCFDYIEGGNILTSGVTSFLRTQSFFHNLLYTICFLFSFITLIFIYCHILRRFGLSSIFFFLCSIHYVPFFPCTYICLICVVTSIYSFPHFCIYSYLFASVMYLTLHCAKSARCLQCTQNRNSSFHCCLHHLEILLAYAHPVRKSAGGRLHPEILFAVLLSITWSCGPPVRTTPVRPWF